LKGDFVAPSLSQPAASAATRIAAAARDTGLTR
jgi:hypothetical protein